METNSNWQISEVQRKLLGSLFSVIEDNDVKNVFDIGSGRTSIQYLTDRYKNLVITGIVFPGDARKIDPIKECVTNTNYEIIEQDIMHFDENQEIDIVLAHLFLGEAEQFAENKFPKILEKLFSLKTKYIVMVNLERDNINQDLLLAEINKRGKIIKSERVVSESGDVCLGMTIKLT